jgi:hypothetical protein
MSEEDKDGATLLASDTCEAKNRHMVLEINYLTTFRNKQFPYLYSTIDRLGLEIVRSSEQVKRPPCGSGVGRVVAFE